MTEDTEQIPTPEEIYRTEEMAVRAGLMKRNPDGTCTLTDAGKEWVEDWILSTPTRH